MRQADIFLESEGNAWLARNRDKLGERDPVSDAIEAAGIRPKRVLEVGSANGWRLAKLREKYGCDVMGVEPSMQAGIEAAARQVPTWHSTASTLPRFAEEFDLLIYGFCLYLTDPSAWFNIVAEGDHVLKPGGHLIIHDFIAGADLVARRYKHRDGVMAYHFDFAQLWLAHPWYRINRRTYIDETEMVIALSKSPICKVVP